MSIHVHWFLPTTGDSRGFGPTVAHRAPDVDYLAQVARAADQLGFEAVLTPTGTWCEDSWLATAASGLLATFGVPDRSDALIDAPS
jgi:alkanesulfonate monooxygenase